MNPALVVVESVLALPVLGGSVYAVLCAAALVRFKGAERRPRAQLDSWPPVTVLKPICGLEKGLEENLRSTCQQDYPTFQVVLSAQRADDPALPLLRKIEREMGPERVTVVVDDRQTAPNGKIRNLLGALPYARHDVLVISDSDVRLRPDYLKAIVAPLFDPGVGCACTLYRVSGAGRWYEMLEQLTLNADFTQNLVFAWVTGASSFALGATTAIRRSTLDEIGGLAALSDYLVEDFEMGRRVRASGKRVAIVPYFVDMTVDLAGPGGWWRHQVYWDQNTRAANAAGLFWTVLVRAVPFALLVALVRGFDAVGLGALAGALAIRLSTAALFLGWGLGDRGGVRGLALLPFRDIAGLVSWFLAFVWPTVTWRGEDFILTADGRMVPKEPLA
jgi:ceramide glucosyltransferase